jgi:hypothetical protein
MCQSHQVPILTTRGLAMALSCCLLSPASSQAQVDEERARQYFAEADAACHRDDGRLWGVSLCGPMVFADPSTRTIATSQPAPEAPRPPALGFANTALDWGGVRWSTFVWPMIPADDGVARRRMFLHELFHRVQPQLGLMIVGEPNDHLDTLDGRYWLQLEWRALAGALASSGQERERAVRDALAFRSARRAAFPGSAERERVDELREGLAQYTGTALSVDAEREAVASAIAQLAEYARNPTFVRTFAYPSGAAYGLLLDAWSPGWTRRMRPDDDLGRLLMAAANLEPADDAAAAALRYGGADLRKAEEAREAERQVKLQELTRRFVDGPVLIVPRGRGATLNTTGATPIPGHGTVFLEYRLTTEWGTLTSNGILQSSDGVTLRLPAPFEIDGAQVTGAGWTITLSPGWTVQPAQRNGDSEVRRSQK